MAASVAVARWARTVFRAIRLRSTSLGILKQMPAQTGDAWRTLFEHCLSATSSKPTQKWTRTAQTLIEAIGRDEFKSRIVRWFESWCHAALLEVDPGTLRRGYLHAEHA